MILALTLFAQGLFGLPQKKTSTVSVALMDAGDGHRHTEDLKRIIATQCGVCDLEVFSLYVGGELDPKKALAGLREAAKKARIIHFSWNIPYTEAWRDFVGELEDIIEKGKIVVGASGQRVGLDQNGSIDLTVLGRVQGIYLIGEVNKEGRAPRGAYYGSKIFASFPPPQGHQGSSFSSILFTIKFALNLEQNSPQEWASHLAEKKKYQIDLHPNLDYFFGPIAKR